MTAISKWAKEWMLHVWLLSQEIWKATRKIDRYREQISVLVLNVIVEPPRDQSKDSACRRCLRYILVVRPPVSQQQSAVLRLWLFIHHLLSPDSSNLKQKSIGSALSYIFVGKPDKHHLLQKSNDCKKCKFRPGCDSLFGDSMSDSAEHDMRGWHRHAWQGSLMDDGQRVIARQGERERGDHISNFSSAPASAG